MNELQIGNNLRKLRFANGEITQARLAEMVGVTRQTVIALESGRYAPSLKLAMKLALVFEIPIDNVFFWKDKAIARQLLGNSG